MGLKLFSQTKALKVKVCSFGVWKEGIMLEVYWIVSLS